MKIPLLTLAVLAGLLPVAVRGQLPLRYFNCEAGAACRDGESRGRSDNSDKTLLECADKCDEEDKYHG